MAKKNVRVLLNEISRDSVDQNYILYEEVLEEIIGGSNELHTFKHDDSREKNI